MVGAFPQCMAHPSPLSGFDFLLDVLLVGLSLSTRLILSVSDDLDTSAPSFWLREPYSTHSHHSHCLKNWEAKVVQRSQFMV